MSQISLKANEAKVLTTAAAADGRIVFPGRFKEATRLRLAELFAQHGLAETVGDTLQLTRAGYRAIGLRPPRASAASGSGEGRVTTRDLMQALLRRDAGASVAEVMDATGWLPHTTRAALSRLRSGGHALAKSKREDGTTCYRLLPAEAEAAAAAVAA